MTIAAPPPSPSWEGSVCSHPADNSPMTPREDSTRLHTSSLPNEERVFEACWRAHELAEIMVHVKMWSPSTPPGVDMRALHARAQLLRQGLMLYRSDVLSHLDDVIRYVARRMSAGALEILCRGTGDALHPYTIRIDGECDNDLEALFSNMTL
jgi:hypothetical protein